MLAAREDRKDPEPPRGQPEQRQSEQPSSGRAGPRPGEELVAGPHEGQGERDRERARWRVEILDDVAHAGDDEQHEADPPRAALPTVEPTGHDEEAEAGQRGDRRRPSPKGEWDDLREELHASTERRDGGGEQRDDAGQRHEGRDHVRGASPDGPRPQALVGHVEFYDESARFGSPARAGRTGLLLSMLPGNR